MAPEIISERDVVQRHLQMFGWSWNTRLIVTADIGKRVTMVAAQRRITIAGDAPFASSDG